MPAQLHPAYQRESKILTWICRVPPTRVAVESAARLPAATNGSSPPVDLAAVCDIDDVDVVLLVVDEVDDPVGGSACSVQAKQRAEQRLADAVWVVCQRPGTELQHCRRHGPR